MCSHYVGQTARAKLARFGVYLPDLWEPPPGGMHIYPTQLASIIRRPIDVDSGDGAVSEKELVQAHFGLLPTFAKDVKYGLRTYNARSETAATLASFRTA
jgi:putative SOS response-associated peptidase YedK